jgi:hypothetical protein
MAAIADSFVVQFLTGDFVMGLAKPAVIVIVVGFMFWMELKPRLEDSDAVKV